MSVLLIHYFQKFTRSLFHNLFLSLSLSLFLSRFYYSVAYDYETIDTTLSIFAGGFVAPGYINLTAFSDGMEEELEGFVIVLRLLESELDPRDVGLVNISRSIYLVRIRPSGTLTT